MSFHGFGLLSSHQYAWIPILLLALVGVYFFNKGIQQSQKEAQAEIGQTNIIFSIILIAMCIAGFCWYYLK
ncbi:MAG: hypothetical protein DBY41_06755 [Clostridium sp.]|nr:MAG: hypothetical protein DBY41_06755 [Clostridium sp.]